MTEPAHRKLRVLDSDRALFRDPAPRGPELKVRIARALARAEALPVAIPNTDLSLVTVDADVRGVELVFGAPDEIGRVRLERAAGAPRVSARVVMRDVQSAARHRPFLERAGQRFERSVSDERWEEAMDLARELARSPADVPMTFVRQFVEGIAQPTGLVRVGFQCNQDCGMCWQGRDWGRYDSDAVLTWIEDLARAGAKHLMISGGEPTMDRRLADYLARAKALGFERVTIETNAILAARDGLAAKLRAAGLDSAFVSLHSGDAATSDAITRAPGTHARTVTGIRALLDAEIDVELNAVMTREGLAHIAELPAFIAREFGGHPRLGALMLSFPTVSFDRELLPAIIPDPEALHRALSATIERASALGVRVRGLDGPCGPPLCAFDADPRVTDRAPVTGPVPFRRHLAPCEQCSVSSACFGVHDMAANMFGDSAARPL